MAVGAIEAGDDAVGPGAGVLVVMDGRDAQVEKATRRLLQELPAEVGATADVAQVSYLGDALGQLAVGASFAHLRAAVLLEVLRQSAVHFRRCCLTGVGPVVPGDEPAEVHLVPQKPLGKSAELAGAD